MSTPNKVTPDVRARLINLFKSEPELKLAAIARRFDLSSETVRKILVAEGLWIVKPYVQQQRPTRWVGVE